MHRTRRSLQEHLQMGLTRGMSRALQSWTTLSHSPDAKLSKQGRNIDCFSLPYSRFPVKLGLSLAEAVGGRKTRENTAGKMPTPSRAWRE